MSFNAGKQMSHVRNSDTDDGVNPYEPLVDVDDTVAEQRRQQTATVAESVARSLPVAIVSAVGTGALAWAFLTTVGASFTLPVRVMLIFGPALAVSLIAVGRASRHLGRRSGVVLSAISSLMVGAVPILVIKLLRLLRAAVLDVSLTREWGIFAGASGVTLLITVLAALVMGKSAAAAEEA